MWIVTFYTLDLKVLKVIKNKNAIQRSTDDFLKMLLSGTVDSPTE